MFSIGDLARHGRVSVRMLRHYDAIGLLPPDRVDPDTGYRWYEVAQLGRLNRIVALKELGFTLEQVKSIVESKVDVAELRGMLRLRQAELQSQIASDTARLVEVEQRLQLIETEGGLPGEDVVVKPLPAVRVAELTGRAGGFEPRFITPIVRPLFTELCLRLDRAGVTPVGPAIAYYEREDDESVIVHAAIPVNRSAEGVAIVDLPAVGRAATIVHHGPIEQVMSTVQLLARWFDANGLRPAGYGRELYLHTGEGPWITELQEPIGPEPIEPAQIAPEQIVPEQTEQEHEEDA
jgi:DNA-binding transcriptional MerR regulator